MFRINRDKNTISPLQARSFTDLGFTERNHLQEWIAEQPSCLGEDFLIIQKEFSGFSDTQERLDLLALDKRGALVVIENKLDDTGRDVTWQALKYVSYCSNLSKENIRKIYQEFLDKNGSNEKAEDNFVDFFDVEDYEKITLNQGVTQRIILIAAKFRKEVTSTVLWLLNFKLRLQCFKVTPFSMDEELFLNVEQIIPTRDAEEYMIGLAEKAQDEVTDAAGEKSRHIICRTFWAKIIKTMADKSKLFLNISPSGGTWILATSGSIGFGFSAIKTYGRAELYIDRGDKEENKWIFDQLFKNKDQIESEFGGQLIWERLDGKKACRVKSEADGNIYDREQWPVMIEFMTDAMVRMEKAFLGPLNKINLEQKWR